MDDVALDVRKVCTLLALVDVLFVVLHLASYVFMVGGEPLLRRHELVHLDVEASFATRWQELKLAGAAMLCAVVAAAFRGRMDGQRRHWLLLAAILVLFVVDEGSGLHERLVVPMRSALDIEGGLLTYAWVVPGAVAVVVFGATFFRFWLKLPRAPRSWIGVGGGLFVLGGLGIEMLGGDHAAAGDSEQGYATLVALEEGLELAGVTFTIVGVLRMVEIVSAEVDLRLEVRRHDGRSDQIGVGRRGSPGAVR